MYGPLKLCGEVIVDAPAAAGQEPLLMRTNTVLELFWYQNSVVLTYTNDSPNVFNITHVRNVPHNYMAIRKIAGRIAWHRLHAPQNHGPCDNGEKNHKVSMSTGACSRVQIEVTHHLHHKMWNNPWRKWLRDWRNMNWNNAVKTCRPTKLWQNCDEITTTDLTALHRLNSILWRANHVTPSLYNDTQVQWIRPISKNITSWHITLYRRLIWERYAPIDNSNVRMKRQQRPLHQCFKKE